MVCSFGIIICPNCTLSALMDEEGVSLADLLEGLAEERQAIYQERYGGTP